MSILFKFFGKKHIWVTLSLMAIVVVLLFIGFPRWVSRYSFVEQTKAASTPFVMQTGYYVGSGTDDFSITAPGWSPDFVLIRAQSQNASIGALFKTSAMAGETTATTYKAQADVASDAIQSLDSTGFTLGTYADVNTKNVSFTWIAFDGSDCTSTGTFCVGSYTGDGATSQAIISVGFQPDLVMVKSSGATEGVFRMSSMPDNTADFFGRTADSTNGTYFKTLDSSGFTVGNNAAVNTNGTNYWYVAFKQISGQMNVGSYAGNSTDDRNITGVGFMPDFVFVSCHDPSFVLRPYTPFTITELGDTSTNFYISAVTTDWIQELQADGFQIGTASAVNTTGYTYYYAAFGGAVDPTPAGTFTMAQGSYTGTKATTSITGIGFTPDLVMIKGDVAKGGAIKTSLMAPGYSCSLYQSGTSACCGIISIDADGFTIGSLEQVNNSGTTFEWQAFGNAFDPHTNAGALDFAIGYYTGTGIDNRIVKRIGFQPDIVVVKDIYGQVSPFRTPNHIGDTSSLMSFIANGADYIQATTTDGFQLGTTVEANGSARPYYFFAFKTGTNLVAGTYTGNGSTQSITGLGFSPELVWGKGAAATTPFSRPSTLAGNASQYITAFENTTNCITTLDSDGFSLGTNASCNGSDTYYYIAWNDVKSGSLYSSSIDTDDYPTISSKNALRLSWTQEIPTGCSLAMYVRGTNTGTTPDYSSSTWAGPYTSATATGTQNLTGVAALQGKRYFQYRADMVMCAANPTQSSTLFDVYLDFD